MSECESCRYYQRGRRCDAYAAIPTKLWEGGHRSPHPGDNGLRYERNPHFVGTVPFTFDGDEAVSTEPVEQQEQEEERDVSAEE